MTNRIAPTLIVLALAATACTSDRPGSSPAPTDATTDTATEKSDAATDTTTDNGTVTSDAGGTPDDPPRIQPASFAPASLTRFDECGEFLDHVRGEALERVGPYGFEGDGWWGPGFEDFAVDESFDGTFDEGSGDTESTESTEAMAEEDGGDNSAPSDTGTASADHSETNVQVDGVDEPDIVKTDGDRILVVSGDRLHLVEVTENGASGSLRGSVQLSSQAVADSYVEARELLLAGDRAFVIGTVQGWFEPEVVFDDAPLTTDVEEEFASQPVEPSSPIGGPVPGLISGPATVVHEIDLSDPDDVRIVNTLRMDGRYISARVVDDTARLAISTSPAEPGFVFPSNANATDSAERFNRDLVAAMTASDWLPSFTLDQRGGDTQVGELVACDRVHAPEAFAGFDILSVVTLDLSQPLAAPSDTSAVMASGDTVYATQDRFYVASNTVPPPTADEVERGTWGENYETAIHGFSIGADGTTTYEASGTVEGHLINQFAMNDRDGVLYVATTTGAPWNTNGSESGIVALQADGDRLEVVGSIDGLGRGERIFSVRYVDDLAYVVTFRQVDPFYVVDLSDPTDLRLLGELKIPGFSSYLHPLGDDLVIGVGQDATDDGFVNGAKVSLFDVSDPTDPREVDVWTLRNGGGEFEFDHRAFLYWEPEGMAVLPVTSWSGEFTGAVVLEVGEDGIEERGRVDHADRDRPVIGSTDCEVIDGEGLTEDDGDLFWMTMEGQLQLCGDDDRGGAAGHTCEVFAVDDFQLWTNDGEVDTRVDLDGVDRVELCWPDGGPSSPQILRTLVIGDQLWSMSHDHLQANDIASLDLTDRVPLR